MKNKAKVFGIYLPVFAILLTIVTVLRTVALFLDFDFNTGYFIEKTISNVSNYVTIASAVFFLTYIFTARRDIRLIPDFTSPATYVPTGIVAVALVFMIKELIFRAIETKRFIDILKYFSTSSAQLSSQRLFLALIVLTLIFSVLSMVHFLLTALIEKNSSEKRASYGLLTVLFLSFYGLYVYFSTDLPINAPNKALDQMTCLLAAVFFLYETRLSLGREKWRPYIAFGFVSSFVGIYASLPAIIVYFANGEIISSSIYESSLTLALSAFILSRILLTGELIEDKPSATVASLLQFADARESLINPAAKAADVIEISGEMLAGAEGAFAEDGNQITIEDISEHDNGDELPTAAEETFAEDSEALTEEIENNTDDVLREEKE